MKSTRLPIALVALLAFASLAPAACGNGHGRARTASSTTSSISGDLGKVAYELDGDIYVKSLPDGEPKRIAKGTMPHWSPSGEWLLLQRDDATWLVREDGSGERQVMEGSMWLPKADRLVYRNDNTIGFERVDGGSSVEGQGFDPVLDASGLSPNGDYLAFDQLELLPPSTPQTAGTGKTPVVNRRASLWVAEVDGTSKPVELYSSTTDGILVAGWTADSESVLFWRDVSFSASAMADGLPLEAIPAQGGQPLALAAGHLALWSPSPIDQRIAMTVPPGRDTWTQKRIAIVDAGTAVLQYLTPEDRVSIQPSWSLDGRQIAFVSKPDTAGDSIPAEGMESLAFDRRIWVMNSDGTAQRPLTGDSSYRDEYPQWSVDGSEILFARLNGDRFASLWLMQSSGGLPEQVVDRIESSTEGLTGYYTNLDWSSMFDWWQPSG